MTTTMRRRRSNPRLRGPAERGAVLLLGLVLLLILTVFGVFALNGSILQERMAGNYRDQSVAFQSAEMGLRWGESWLQSRTPLQRPFPCQNANLSLCVAPNSVLDANMVPHTIEDEFPGTGTWLALNLQYGTDPEDGLAAAGSWSAVGGVAQQPSFLLEQAFNDRDDLAGNPQQGRVFYRIYAGATGARDSSVAVLESSVAKRFE